jgi:hypothetical protein
MKESRLNDLIGESVMRLSQLENHVSRSEQEMQEWRMELNQERAKYRHLLSHQLESLHKIHIELEQDYENCEPGDMMHLHADLLHVESKIAQVKQTIKSL